MNKIIWMCWFQGLNDENIPNLNKECIKKWKELNPTWTINILSNKSIPDYVPEFIKMKKMAKFDRNYTTQSDILRLLLLKKYGGVWADASLYPMQPLDSFLSDILNKTGFFTYRFMERSMRRELVSWFLVVNHPNHYLIKKWADILEERYINAPVHWSTGNEGKKIDPNRYFEPHAILSNLYDTDFKIKSIIDNMVQISEKIPHSALKNWRKRKSSFMYKRPKLPLFKNIKLCFLKKLDYYLND